MNRNGRSTEFFNSCNGFFAEAGGLDKDFGLEELLSLIKAKSKKQKLRYGTCTWANAYTGQYFDTVLQVFNAGVMEGLHGDWFGSVQSTGIN